MSTPALSHEAWFLWGAVNAGCGHVPLERRRWHRLKGGNVGGRYDGTSAKGFSTPGRNSRDTWKAVDWQGRAFWVGNARILHQESFYEGAIKKAGVRAPFMRPTSFSWWIVSSVWFSWFHPQWQVGWIKGSPNPWKSSKPERWKLIERHAGEHFNFLGERYDLRGNTRSVTIKTPENLGFFWGLLTQRSYRVSLIGLLEANNCEVS